MLPAYVVPDSPLSFNTWPAAPALSVWALFLGTFVFAQVFRYRHVSTPSQRVQTKWVVLGVVGAAVGHFGGMLLNALQPAQPTSSGALLATLAGDTLMYASVLLIPLTIGIATLRHHLYDVDRVIRLTLDYSALAAVLALVYEGGVIAAERMVLAVTGESSFAAKVLVAFAAGALARPVHRRLDRAITWAFYPRKYEAERRIEAFGKQVRQDQHIETVSERLAQVVTRRRLQARPPHMPPVIHDLERTSGPRALPRGMSQPLMRQERDAEWVPPPHPRRPP